MKNESVFIVEDDKFFNDLLKGKIQSLGYYDVVSFNKAESCIENLYKIPHIVLLDHNLKGVLNGLETLKKIKEYNPNIFVIYISGQKDMQIAIDSLKYGSFDYIVKDKSTMDRLESIIKRIEQFEQSRKQSTIVSTLKSIFSIN